RGKTEEDPTPADLGRDETGDGGADESGNDPGGGHERQHAGAGGFGIAATEGDVRDGGDETAAKALDGAADDEDDHRRGETADEKTGGEAGDAGEKGNRGTAAVGLVAGDDEADQVGQHEGAEGPTVVGESAEVVDGGRHDGGDGEGFEGAA